MSFLDHIRACNNYAPARVVPLLAGSNRIGLVRRDNAQALRRFPDVFAVEQDRVILLARGDVSTVSAAVDEVVEALVAENRVPKWRNETFDVAARWGAPPVFRLDRGAVPFFGTRAYGVHLNGYCRDGGNLKLWIGRRAPDKKVAPDKLDNIVAGGIGNGHGVEETLLKESEEEASLPTSLTRNSVPVGAVSYRMETELGIRDDVLFVYDLEMPADCVPQNQDGEIVQFELMSAADVLERVRTTEDFKFNVNLVMLDFAVRHGLLRPSDPEYLDAATGLHRPLDWGETPSTSSQY
jgi:8-oxo-dGTP pyrophosphatase MutT (NUDIX family)